MIKYWSNYPPIHVIMSGFFKSFSGDKGKKYDDMRGVTYDPPNTSNDLASLIEDFTAAGGHVSL